MSEDFLLHIHNRQNRMEVVPSNDIIAGWAFDLLDLIYPERKALPKYSLQEVKALFQKLELELVKLLDVTKACNDANNQLVAKNFFEAIPELYRVMNTDVEAILEGDPASRSEFEIIRTYPGFLAISLYRLAHALLKLDVPLIPRILTERAHSLTGIDIHPGAQIGEYLYIDHGTGIVIGETSIIGDHVKLYQGVTLGALSVEKYMANIKRHPTIEDHVIIYAGATILGGETIVGRDCIIGGNVWLTKSVPPGATVYHQSTVKVIEANKA
ncbi:serine acetyltransferase [Olivibacter sp. SDN3]|uniref:serine O-acetyltransferase EpsC n=1 Tax=Olivibacter sp. SDN3 TaxID=2764720 RepID=UPI001650DA5F|nr:serine O-acetyltransferase EpsC [Olivibacter sp. SDN3]QNL49632.1 serine acetyltransferase [Olivibacter sp. SDN3]